MEIVLDELWLFFIVIVELFLFRGLYAWGHNSGYDSGYVVGKSHARRENESLQEALDKSQKTTEKLKSEIAELKTQLLDKTKRLEQLEASKDQEIAKAIEARQAELQSKHEQDRQELEPKIRAEYEKQLSAKMREMEKRMEKEREEDEKRFRYLLEITLEGNQELLRLFDTSPSWEAVHVLKHAAKDKELLRELQTAAQLGKDDLSSLIKIKATALKQEGKKARTPIEAQIEALLARSPMGVTELAGFLGKAKSTISDSLQRLAMAGRVTKGEDGRYYLAVGS